MGKVSDADLPRPPRITGDHSWMSHPYDEALHPGVWKAHLQKMKNYVHDKLAEEYIKQLRYKLKCCILREGFAEARKFCQPLIREYLDAIAPLNHIKFIWDEEELEKYKDGYYLKEYPFGNHSTRRTKGMLVVLDT